MMKKQMDKMKKLYTADLMNNMDPSIILWPDHPG